MDWFRKHVKTGSRLALFALAIQFALSFGHFHAIAAPAIQAGLSQAALADIGTFAAPEAAQKQVPSTPDTDQQPADGCAICAVIALAGNVLFATPPVLLLPQAVELRYLATDVEFVHLASGHPAFQSRAPPVS
jgi:hypothetical protein